MRSYRSERRHSFRVRVPGGAAICHCQSGVSRYDVVDASRGGTLLEHGRMLLVGSSVRVDLFWAGIGSMSAHAHVVRSKRNRQRQVALEFDTASVAGDELLSDLALVAVNRRAAATAMIYSNDSDQAELLTSVLGCTDIRPAVARTPLEAICLLQDPWLFVKAVLFEATIGGLEMASFIRDEFPEMRRVLMTGTRGDSDDLALLEAGLAQGVVDRHVTGHELHEALVGSSSGPHPYAQATTAIFIDSMMAEPS